MKKEEIKRILIVLIIFIFTVFLSILGIKKYNEGYGTNGKMRIQLNPLVKTFNSQKEIKNSDKYLKASVNNNSIKVSYMIDANKYELDYIYTTNSTSQYLTIEYDKTKKDIAELVSSYLIETSSYLNGSVYGSIFNKYTYNNLYSFDKINDGIELYKENDNYILTFELNKNIYSIINSKLNNEDNYDYITTYNINNLVDELNTNNVFKYEKKDIYLYVTLDNNYYNIYISNKNSNIDNTYNSIMSVLKIIRLKLYNEIKTIDETFTKDENKVGYKVNIKPELNDELKSLKRDFINISLKN